MVVLVLDREIQRSLIRERQARGTHLHDEVWNGVYVVPPLADNEHQFLCGKLHSALSQAITNFQGDNPEGVFSHNYTQRQLGKVYPTIKVSDRSDHWRKNFRCPDVSVFLGRKHNHAKDKKTHWQGGPDFVVEVITPRDRSKKKLSFYSRVGVRELLLVDRKPWSLELYRLEGGELKLVSKIVPFPPQSESSPDFLKMLRTVQGELPPDPPPPMLSHVLPLSFRLLTDGIGRPEQPSPTIEIIHTEDARRWLI